MKRLEKRYGFVPSLAVTILLSALLELSGIWWTMLIAGFIGGLLAKRLQKGIAVGFIGVLIGWTLYFLLFWIVAPSSANLAFSQASFFAVLTLLLGGILGGLSGAIGSLAATSVLPSVKEPEQKPSDT